MSEEKNNAPVRNVSEKWKKAMKFVQDLHVYVNAVKWIPKKIPLRQFAATFQEPQLIRIVSGQYNNLGSSPNLTPLMFVWSRRIRRKIRAQRMDSLFSFNKKLMKHGDDKMYPIGDAFEILDDYEGWFEVLSENGDPLIHIDSVGKLSNHYLKTFTVMERIDHVHMHRLTEGEDTWDDVRALKIGEVITVGRILWPVKEDDTPPCGCCRMLELETSEGQKVYVDILKGGRFSEKGEEEDGDDDISGAQTVKTLLRKRFPMNVKLTEGQPLQKGMKPPQVLRLMSKEAEQVVEVLPFYKDAPVVDVPTSGNLKVVVPANLEEVSKMEMHAILKARIEGMLRKEPLKDKQSSAPQSSQPSDTSSAQPSTSSGQVSTSSAQASSAQASSASDNPTSPDPYDEVDEVYADMKRIAAERSHIPMEKETFM